MVPLGDEALVQAHFSPFRDSGNLDARSVDGLRRTYHRLGKSFWMDPMELLGDVGRMESLFFLLGDSVRVSARYVHGLC